MSCRGGGNFGRGPVVEASMDENFGCHGHHHGGGVSPCERTLRRAEKNANELGDKLDDAYKELRQVKHNIQRALDVCVESADDDDDDWGYRRCCCRCCCRCCRCCCRRYYY